MIRYGKATFQAQSSPGDIYHLKITGGKGIYRRESGDRNCL
jgi:hypothetical protein